MRDNFSERSDSELDALLDAALSTYALIDREQEAIADVTSRTMAAVHASAFSKKKITWGLCALPFAAALLLSAVLVPLRHPVRHEAHTSPQQVLHAIQASKEARVETPQLPRFAARRVSEHVRRKAPVPSEPLPKLDVFPTPTPLSPEEQSLLAMARREPEQARQAAAMPEPKPIELLKVEPLTIAAIDIPPLNPREKREREK